MLKSMRIYKILLDQLVELSVPTVKNTIILPVLKLCSFTVVILILGDPRITYYPKE